MDCEEIRIDMRIPDPENRAENRRAVRVMYQLNHTMPYTEEYNDLLKELFGENLGQNSYVTTPINGACVSTMKIGNGVFINSNLLAMARGGITILTCKPVLIKEAAWIGAGATILPGVCVGRHAVVGAASVVTKDVPDYAVVVGNPARVIKYLDADRFEQ